MAQVAESELSWGLPVPIICITKQQPKPTFSFIIWFCEGVFRMIVNKKVKEMRVIAESEDPSCWHLSHFTTCNINNTYCPCGFSIYQTFWWRFRPHVKDHDITSSWITSFISLYCIFCLWLPLFSSHLSPQIIFSFHGQQ